MLYLKHPVVKNKEQKLYVYNYAKELCKLNNLIIDESKDWSFYNNLDDFIKIIYSNYDIIDPNVHYKNIKDEIANLQKTQKMNNEITPELFEKYYSIWKLQKD